MIVLFPGKTGLSVFAAEMSATSWRYSVKPHDHWWRSLTWLILMQAARQRAECCKVMPPLAKLYLLKFTSQNWLMAPVNCSWLLPFQLRLRHRKKWKQYRAIFQLEMQVAFWLLGFRNGLRDSLPHSWNLRAANCGNCHLPSEINQTYRHLCSQSHQTASQAQTLRSGDELWTLLFIFMCLFIYFLNWWCSHSFIVCWTLCSYLHAGRSSSFKVILCPLYTLLQYIQVYFQNYKSVSS